MNWDDRDDARRPRREDDPLVRGAAPYMDDFQPGDERYLAILRSPYGHARLAGIDKTQAEALPGVVGVITAADIEASGVPGAIAPTETASSLYGIDDPDVPARAQTRLVQPRRPFLAEGTVRYAGEPVAAVLAEDRYTAHDALDSIAVEYDRLESVIEPERAVEPEAPRLHESIRENKAFDWAIGDRGRTQTTIDNAPHSVRVDIPEQRICPTSMEPRGALAEYRDGALVVRAGTQSPHRFRTLLVESLALEEDDVRVIAPEVGGGFGIKSKNYPAEPLAAWCAMETGRPVKWQATRSESLLADNHGRGRTIHGELGFDADGRIEGLWVESYANLGAYVSRGAPGTRSGSFVDVISGQYRIPEIHTRVVGCLTNTVPVGSFRGSSRVESILAIERLIQRAAREIDLDPAEFRRRNFIRPDSFPYETPVRSTYDSGDYERALDVALDLVDYEAIRRRQERDSDDSKRRGIGLSAVLDNAGTSREESARITLDGDGRVTVFVGTADQGQGHRTAFAQLVAGLLGVPFEAVAVKEGDTAFVPIGGGTSGSRSVVCGGEVIRRAAESVIDEATDLAADHLETTTEDLAFDAGRFSVRGAPDRSVTLLELAKSASTDATVIDESAAGSTRSTYPFGLHAAVVSIETETGEITIDDYVAVDDCGNQINPRLVEGQIVGGVVQGIGQAIYEGAAYDENGSLVSGSLMDYVIPRANQVPEIRTDHTVTPSPNNPLGVKGTAEAGATAAPAAVTNAVMDALGPLGIEELDRPITPEVVWSAIDEAT